MTRDLNWGDPLKKSHEFKRKLFKRYGIQFSDYEKMWADQKGLCAICQSPAKAIDHNHTTGKVRGLLCMKCNVWLAPIEATDWLLKAASYLMKGQ